MEFLYHAIVVLHLLGMAAVVGGWLTVVRAPRMLPGVVHGALLQVLTGLILVGMLEAGVGEEDEAVNHAKVGIKLAVALVVAVLAWVNRKRDDAPSGVVHAVGGLAVLNVLIAALWE